jgi:hypothetical protein
MSKFFHIIIQLRLANDIVHVSFKSVLFANCLQISKKGFNEIIETFIQLAPQTGLEPVTL